MSRSVDLFIDSALPAGELAAQIERLTDLPVAPNGEGTWTLSEGAVTAELAEHRYADDGDLWLTRYRYALSARVPGAANPRDSAEALLLRRVAQALHRNGSFPVLLVLDLQYRDAEPVGSSAAKGGDDD
ncbi:MAG: hypothetical protein ACR2KC_01915 [Acidimicrobiales bacterium]